MLNKTLEKEFRDGLKSPLYYIWSDDHLLLGDALSRSIDVVISGHPVDFNYDLFYPAASSQQILDAVSTLPFMAKRRLVVLKDFHQFPEPTINELMPYLQEPSETTCMIILSSKAPKRGWNINWKVYHLNIREKDMPLWLKGLSSRKGIRLTDDAINLLLEFTGYDTGHLSMEVEKLRHSGKKTITDRDVIYSITMMRHFTSFELIDSITRGDKTRALRILKMIFKEGNPAAVAPPLLGALNWHFREFYNLWLNRGKRPPRMRSDTYNNLKKYLPFYNEDRFYKIFKGLHEADIGIKTGGMAELVMEVLLINLFSAMADQPAGG